jgi:hypothetical protein
MRFKLRAMEGSMFNRRLAFAGLIACAASPAWAQQRTQLLDALTQRDATAGVREALGLAATRSTDQLGRVNGFFGNPRIRIPLPGLLGDAQRTMSRFGMSGLLDQLQENINHAAETTMPAAGRLFMNAVRTITIQDAISIVRGGQDSATQYLRGRTETSLTSLLRPHMNTALTQSGAFNLMRGAASSAGISSVTPRLKEDVVNFSTTKALDGAFYYIANEERAIRNNPVHRTTDILRRVFG